jgi:uncharacterized protein (TIRG00374 family)
MHPTKPPCTPNDGGKRGLIPKLFGYGFAVAGLIWVVHGVRFDEVLRDMARINWWWIAAAIACDVASYVCQAIRWRSLLIPTGSISVSKATRAIYAGLFSSEVLPMRVGELVRGYLVSRWIGVGFIAVVPSMVVERLFDGIWLAAGIGLSALFVPMPDTLLRAEDIFGAALLIGTAAFIFIVIRKEKSEAGAAPQRPHPWKPLRVVTRGVERLSDGLRQIGFSVPFFVALFVSGLLLLFQILSFWFAMWGYGLHVSFWVGAVVALIVRLGTALPNAPANVGSYQFFCVVALTLFGVEKTLATGFSIAVFVLLTLPLWAIGSAALAGSGMTLMMIRKDLKSYIQGTNRSGGV